MDIVEQPPQASIGDQWFLLNFIMGTYLGPDLRSENPRRSVFQREHENRPTYYISDIGSAFLKLSDVESLYYYVLRNAHPTAALRLHQLYQYFKGSLPLPVTEEPFDKRQFTTLFPPDLHQQGRYKGSFKIFKGILLFDNPDTSYISHAELERFKRLTGLLELKVDRNQAQLYRHGYRSEREDNNLTPEHTDVPRDLPNGNAAMAAQRSIFNKRRRLKDFYTFQPSIPTNMQSIPIESLNEEMAHVQSPDQSEPSILLLAPVQTVEEWNHSSSVWLDGVIKKGRAGPPVGLVDVGTSKDAYLFRVALPGVKKDQRQFSCEIEFDGKVVIRGVTLTGESTVLRNSRVFHMKTRNLCPPGEFTISFNLPGPVDPRLFSGNFGSDGILEAIVKKFDESILNQ